MSCKVFSISKNKDIIAPLGNPCQFPDTISPERFFFLHLRNLNLCWFPIVMSLNTSKTNQSLFSLYSYIRCLCTLIKCSLEPSLLQYEQFHMSLLIFFMALHWTFSSFPMFLLYQGDWNTNSTPDTPHHCSPLLSRGEGSLLSSFCQCNSQKAICIL